jgi:hypothetical protein
LPIQLFCRTRHFAAGFRAMRSLPTTRLIHHDDVMKQLLVDAGRQRGRIDLSCAAYPTLLVSRITKYPPLGPGTAPRSKRI